MQGDSRTGGGRTGAATGHLLEEFVFTNVGRTTCLLRGYPSVSALRPDGKRVLLHPRHGTFFGQLAAANLKPGAHVFLDFETDDYCANGPKDTAVFRDPIFKLRSGGNVRGGKAKLRVVCGLAMSTFGLQARYTGTGKPKVGTLGSLHVQIELPGSVRRGHILNYTVLLENPTQTTVKLKSGSCVGYTEGIYTSAAQTRASYALNCGSVDSLPPRSSAVFAMKLPVPRNAPLGHAKIGWNLNTATGPFVGGMVSVTR